MSTRMEDDIKRWAAKRKAALVMEIIQGKITVAESSRSFDMPPSEIEEWVDEAKKGMENPLRSKPLDIKEQCERQLADLQPIRRNDVGVTRKKKAGLPAGQRGREMILGLQQGLKEEGVEVSLVKLCEWFGVALCTVYYRATKGQPKLQEC